MCGLLYLLYAIIADGNNRGGVDFSQAIDEIFSIDFASPCTVLEEILCRSEENSLYLYQIQKMML
jgi:hypothetical protein